MAKRLPLPARRPLPAPVAAAGLGCGAAALALYAVDGYGRGMLVLWVAGLALLGAYFFAASRPLPRIERLDRLAPVGLALGFAPLYLAGVYDWPVQVNSDEVGIMVWAENHSDLDGVDPFGVSTYLGHPVLLFWVFGSIGDLLGGVDIEHMRLVHGFVGLAVIAAAYGLFRQVASRSTSLLACSFLGFTHSLFMISRMAMRESTAVLLEVIALALLLRGLRQGQAFTTFCGGLVAGLGFYVYFPSRATFFLWLAFLGALAVFFKAQVARRDVARLAAIAATGFLLVAVPISVASLKAPRDLQLQQREALLIFPEAREKQRGWVFAPTVAEGIRTNIEWGLGAFNNERVDRAWAYPNPGHGFLDPLTGVLLWVGVGVVAYRLVRRRGPPWPLLFLASFLVLWLGFAFLVNKAPNYPRLLITLPLVAYFAAMGTLFLARLAGRAIANGDARIASRSATAATVAIVAIVGAWNLSIAWDFVELGRKNGDDIGSTGRYVTAASVDPRQRFHIATDETPKYLYYQWGWAEIWQERLRIFARRPEQIGSVIAPATLRDFQSTPPFVVFMNSELWNESGPYLQARYPSGRTHDVVPGGRLLAFQVPAYLSVRAVDAVLQVASSQLESRAGRAARLLVRVLRPENRAEPPEAVRAEPPLHDLAEALAAEIAGVVVHDVARDAEDAFLLAAPGLIAEAFRLDGILNSGARCVAPVRLEADVHELLLAAPAPVGGLLPVPADLRKDPRGDEQIAVELVLVADDVAWVEEVVLPDPAALEPERRAQVLHEDSAAARDLIELRLQPVAHAQGDWELVARVEHQAVPETVVALVVDERALLDLRVGARLPRNLGRLVLLDPGELPLQQPVVVAGGASRAAGDERLPDLAVEVEQAAGADHVRDRVALGADRCVGALHLVEAL
jgi:4-amino-4-deoxy-L-arabinose transferase-like glycosyltransferase